ncbi:hypothetical protein [Adlercreutzia sp. ZJ473]|nr:hypothetical protein [Adlercreutzia sp. ZJ473]
MRMRLTVPRNAPHRAAASGIAFCEERADLEKLITLADESMYYVKNMNKI